MWFFKARSVVLRREAVHFLRGSCVWRVRRIFRRVAFRCREGECARDVRDAALDREDGAQCSVWDAKHGGQGCKAQGSARAAILFGGFTTVARAHQRRRQVQPKRRRRLPGQIGSQTSSEEISHTCLLSVIAASRSSSSPSSRRKMLGAWAMEVAVQYGATSTAWLSFEQHQ